MWVRRRSDKAEEKGDNLFSFRGRCDGVVCATAVLPISQYDSSVILRIVCDSKLVYANEKVETGLP